MDSIIGRANGTTFLEISKTNFKPMKVLVPPKTILSAFERQVIPLYDRVVVNLEQTQTLKNTTRCPTPEVAIG